MAAYKMLSNGSSGSDVKKLQDALISAGYNVGSSGADGIYGANTADAVRKYQQDNGLSVDGIAGDQTLGKLYGTSNSNTNQQAQEKAPEPIDYSKYSYDPSSNQAYMDALSALQNAQNAIPSYKGTYDQQLQDIYDKILNRDKFSYDINGDALYQQYKDQYIREGKLAMMDTMGQSAALTGGYGNSYGQSVGQQAYNSYLQKLNEVVPELYGMARDQYNQEGEDLYKQYSMVGDMADDEYNKYQNELDRYWQNLNFLKGQADSEYDRGYENWYNSYQMGMNADNNAYDRKQDAYSKLVSLISTTGYVPSASELKEAGMSQAQASAYKDYFDQQMSGVSGGGSSSGGYSGSSYSGNGGSSGGSSGGSGYNNGSLTTAQIQALQSALGVDADGLYGPASQGAAGGLSAEEAYKKYVGDLGSTELTGTKNTSDIISKVMSRSDYYKNTSYATSATGGTTDRYEDYLRQVIQNKSSKLTDNELAYLYNYYNLW